MTTVAEIEEMFDDLEERLDKLLREKCQAEERLKLVETLVEAQYRPIPHDLSEYTTEAFSQGRNWMIDRIREALTQPGINAGKK